MLIAMFPFKFFPSSKDRNSNFPTSDLTDVLQKAGFGTKVMGHELTFTSVQSEQKILYAETAYMVFTGIKPTHTRCVT